MGANLEVELLDGGSTAVGWQEAEAALAQFPDVTSLVERQRAERFVRSSDRSLSLAGATLLRVLVGRLTDEDPRSVVVRRRCPTCGGPHGRPTLDGGRWASIAHAGAVACVAVSSEGPVGVDLEPVGRQATDGLREMILDPRDPTADEPGADLLISWVRKEAVLKATGEGLTVAPSSVWVTSPRAEAGFLRHTGRPGLGCRLTDRPHIPGYRTALAVLDQHAGRMV